MGMRKGFAGLLLLTVFLLGFVMLLGSNSPRIASNEYYSIVNSEIHADRIAIARDVILKSYEEVSDENTAQWANVVESEVSSRYNLRVSIDFQKTPADVSITDPTNGMSTSFLLLK